MITLAAWAGILAIVGVYLWWQYGDLEDRLPAWANWVLVVLGLALAGFLVWAFGINGSCDINNLGGC